MFKNQKYKILTDTGFECFDDIKFNGVREIYRTILEDNIQIETTDDHEIYLFDGDKRKVSDLLLNDLVRTKSGDKRVIDVIQRKMYNLGNRLIVFYKKKFYFVEETNTNDLYICLEYFNIHEENKRIQWNFSDYINNQRKG